MTNSINWTLIDEKCDTILRCLRRIEEKKTPTLDELQLDPDRRDIIVLNLERAVQACVDSAAHVIAFSSLPAPPTMSDSFDLLQRQGFITNSLAIRLRKAVGLRNILVHEYTKIDWTILWKVLENHLTDFKDFVVQIRSRKN